MALRFGPYSPAGIVVPFTPASISGLQIWFRGDNQMWQDTARTNPVTANGQTVKAWDDISGNGNHATGASSTHTYSAATNAGGNSKPGISCTAANPLRSTYSPSAPFTLFAVWQTSLTSGFGRAIDGFSTNWMMGPRQNSGEQVAYYAGNFSGYGPLSTNISLIQMVNQTSSTGTNWVNGVQITGNISSPGLPGQINIAGSSFNEPLSGYVQEIIAYNKTLSTSERQSVERYLGTRYAISTP